MTAQFDRCALDTPTPLKDVMPHGRPQGKQVDRTTPVDMEIGGDCTYVGTAL